MDSTRMLEAVDSGASIPDASVFRFNRTRTTANLVGYSVTAVAILAIGLAMRTSLNLQAGGVLYGAIAVWLLLILASAWRALNKGLDLKHANTNVLLITPVGVVMRLRGRVKSWPFSEYPEIQVVRSDRKIDTIYLNRQGRTFDSELVDDGSFGSMEGIAGSLYQSRPAG
jgi:hypothetical protein